MLLKIFFFFVFVTAILFAPIPQYQKASCPVCDEFELTCPPCVKAEWILTSSLFTRYADALIRPPDITKTIFK